jgi:hypothetical protein
MTVLGKAISDRICLRYRLRLDRTCNRARQEILVDRTTKKQMNLQAMLGVSPRIMLSPLLVFAADKVAVVVIWEAEMKSDG